jgi:hypothetical protein
MIIEIPDVFIAIAFSCFAIGVSWVIAYTLGRKSK